jgi:hypothetical protein
MISREELKSLIDQLPESGLEALKHMLQHHINPPPPNPDHERMHSRGREYRAKVEERFRQTRKPGTIGGIGGGGFSGTHKGHLFSRNGFNYWDDDALVEQTLQSLDGQEIEIMQRFEIAPDRTTLSCATEMWTGGRTVRHEDVFPIVQQKME